MKKKTKRHETKTIGGVKSNIHKRAFINAYERKPVKIKIVYKSYTNTLTYMGYWLQYIQFVF